MEPSPKEFDLARNIVSQVQFGNDGSTFAR